MNSTLSNQSISNSEKINYRQQGKKVDGRIYTGFIRDAASKISVGSIPSKFEVIVFKNNNTKGFNNSEIRFKNQEIECPGPGTYEYPSSNSILYGEKESISKKGYGNGFVSTSERDTFKPKYLNTGPGPGQYNSMETNSFISKTTNATGSIKGSCMFLNRKRNPEIQKENPNTVPLETPGPGEYNPKTKRSINAYHSSFISRSNRDKYLNSNNNPAPGDYNIRTTVLEKKPFQHKGFMSSFSNNVQKHQKADRMQDLVKFLDDGKKKLIIGSNQPIPEQELFTPGPSSYNPKLPDFRPQYLNSQITSNFKEGVKDRFGDFYDQSKNKKPFPGPQAYKKEDIGFNQIQSAMVSGYVFMSETARKPYGDFHKRLGPSRSIPYYLPQQKSFHLNLARNWV